MPWPHLKYPASETNTDAGATRRRKETVRAFESPFINLTRVRFEYVNIADDASRFLATMSFSKQLCAE